MAKDDVETPVAESNLDWPDDTEFETVVEESGAPIDFSEVGSSFTGVYVGKEHIDYEGQSFDVHKFRDREGNIRKVNGGYALNEGLKEVAQGAIVRITRVADVPMSDPGKSAMKDYRIEVAKGA